MSNSPETIRSVCIGIVAENMGFADQSKVVKSGHEVFIFIGNLSYAEFTAMKKYVKKLEINLNKETPSGE